MNSDSGPTIMWGLGLLVVFICIIYPITIGIFGVGGLIFLTVISGIEEHQQNKKKERDTVKLLELLKELITRGVTNCPDDLRGAITCGKCGKIFYAYPYGGVLIKDLVFDIGQTFERLSSYRIRNNQLICGDCGEIEFNKKFRPLLIQAIERKVYINNITNA